jgi:hypothetical protein
MSKTNTNAHIGKSCFFSKLLTLFNIPTWGVGYLPHVMTKLKRDENLVAFIWASEVSYAKVLRDVWDSQN